MLRIDKRAVGPKLPIDLLSSQHLSGSIQQQDQDLERLGVQFDPDPVLAKFSGRDIGFKDSKAISLGCA